MAAKRTEPGLAIVRRDIIARYAARAGDWTKIIFCGDRGKVVFATYDNALQAAQRLAWLGGSDRMYCYRCPVNRDHFHLGSGSSGRRRRPKNPGIPAVSPP